METLRVRCRVKLLILFLIVLGVLITYKIIVIQHYISHYNLNHQQESLKKEYIEKSILKEDNAIQSDLIRRYFRDDNVDSFEGEQIIHLDLKGAPPSLEYFRHLFPLLSALNVTGLLIEYEDIFPYSSRFTRATNTYSKDDIRYLLKIAKENKLEVIPLVQTFGHLEFLLKVYKFFNLREIHRYPQSICPSHNDTFEILTGMLDEIIALHPSIHYIHIGCDEVYQLGVCPKCKKKMAENRWSTKELFLNHVTKLARYIRVTYPHITPLIWDDELRSIPVESLQKFEVGKLLEPVIWSYTSRISFSFNFWEKYSKIFSSVWIASSFKGTDGPDQILPDINHHLLNHKSWLQVVHEYSYLIKFKGIIVTGWQRYDHFAVLCELLPVSIPSLVNSILILKGSALKSVNISKNVKDVLACGRHYEMHRTCTFPGVELYKSIAGFYNLRKDIERVLDSSYIKGWLTEHNLQQGYFNPLLVEELAYKVHDCEISLNRSKKTLMTDLKYIYDSYTVTEWTETFVQPYFIKLSGISGILRYIMNITEWAPRPIELINSRKYD